MNKIKKTLLTIVLAVVLGILTSSFLRKDAVEEKIIGIVKINIISVAPIITDNPETYDNTIDRNFNSKLKGAVDDPLFRRFKIE
ncbi:hypothetical protein ACFLRB_01110 [Acidobacteriota bacterium]